MRRAKQAALAACLVLGAVLGSVWIGWGTAANAQPAAPASAGPATPAATPAVTPAIDAEAAGAAASATPAPALPASASGAVPASATAPAAHASAAPAGAPPAGMPATVQQPRAFGHVIGDVLSQRVLLEHGGRPLTPSALPPADRVGLWLERREARTERDGEGRTWLRLDYQVLNAPRALTTVALPALQVATAAGPTLVVPAWPVSIGPLTPATVAGQGDLQPLRPDRPVAPLPTAALRRQLALPLVALGGVLLAWLGWWAWRTAREAQRLPFAKAWHDLRRLARHQRGEPIDARAEAWLAMHQALNATAGRVVHHASLPRLLAEQPHLQPFGKRLDAFFRQSAARFFAGAPAGTGHELIDLCRALRQAERREAR